MPHRHDPKSIHRALAFLAILMLPFSAGLLADNENETVGFKPNHIFESGTFGENIDVLNGGLNLGIPIGLKYPVSAHLSYQLHLSYSSKTWDTASWGLLGQVYPGRRGPVGFGFSMNFGRFYRDIQRARMPGGLQNVYAWKWISPDGTEHEFGTFAEAAPGVGAGYKSPKPSTYDGSGCSVTLPAEYSEPEEFSDWNGTDAPVPVIKIGCGDGIEYTFEHLVQVFDGPGTADPFNAARPITANEPYDGMRRRYNQDFGGWYVTLIEDRKSALVELDRPGHPLHGRTVRAGWVHIEYETAAGFEHVIKRITDSVLVNDVGREIVLTNVCAQAGGSCVVSPWDLDASKPRLSVRTTAVTLPAFGGSTEMVPSATATWTFEYSDDLVKNLLHSGSSDPYPHDTTERMLKVVNFPATTTPAGTSPSPYRLTFGYDQYGELESRTLPTGARVSYLWEGYSWGGANPGYFGAAGGSVEGFSQAVTSKTLDFDPSAGGYDGEWRYTRDASGYLSNPRKVTVKDIAGNETVFSFHASPKSSRPEDLTDSPTDGYAPEWNDGLNYRTEYYQGSGATRTLVRTSTRAYEASQGDGDGMPDRWDIRVNRETTIFEDDNRRTATVESYDYVAAGLHRLKKETGDGIPGPRWTRTQYIGSDPSIYDYQETYDGERVLSRRDVVHSAIDLTPPALARRVYQEIDHLNLPGLPGTGSSPAAPGDITTDYTYDALGDLTEKRVSDGDPTTEYRTNYGYTAGGQLATKEFYQRGTTNLYPWKAIDRLRDANTGLIFESRDSASIATQYDYDDLGRLITITPPGGERPTEIIYDHQVDGNGHVTLRRTVVRQGQHADMGANTSCAPSAGDYLMTCFEYDSLGRVSRTERRPESATSAMPYQFKTYDLQDRVTFESKWLPPAPGETCVPAAPEGSCGTLYDYHDPVRPTETDPFGRVRRVRTADGTETTTSYFGLSSEVTVHGVQGVDAQGEPVVFDATTTYLRDVWGRLIYVDVPPGGGSDAAYAYDARDNLIAVQMEDAPTQTVQNRTFEYDALNRLRSSWNPESGGSTVVKFDPLGNVLEKRDSTGNRVLSSFDGAGRLVSVSRKPYELPTSVDPVELVRNTYDQSDTGGHIFGASAGRLTKTESFDDDHVLIATKELKYDTSTGRLAEERTYFPGWNPVAPLKYTYNLFGLVSRIDYPEGPAGRGGAFGVGYSYSNGYLTQMHDAAVPATIFGTATYNHAGGFREITTLGSVKTAIEPDEMFRTRSITVTRTNVTPQETHLSTGEYVYDGAGNIATIGATPDDRSSYAYDAANRLVSASIWNGATNRVQTFVYDDFGNMVDKTTTVSSGTTIQDIFGRTGINRTLDHAVYLNGGTTAQSENLFDYDARGNLILSDDLVHEYDARDRMVAVRGVAADFVARYSYDAASYRVQKEERSRDLRTFYVRDGAGRLMSEFRRTRIGTYDPEWTKHYLYFGNRLLGLRENTRPGPPGRLTATTTTGGSVTVSWLASPAGENVTSYKLYRSPASGTPQWTQVCATVNLTCTNAATPDNLYKYQVTAINASGEGYGSDITLYAGDDMPPSQPTGLEVRGGDRRIDVSWDPNDPAEYIAGYYVYRSVMAGQPPHCIAGAGLRVTPTPITTTSYSELNVGVDTALCYSVSAVDSVGQESLRTNPESGTARDYAPPSPPTGVSAVVDCLSTTGPVVSWNPNASYEFVNRYVVYRTPAFTSDCSEGFETPCGIIPETGLTYPDASAVAGETYRYEVVALDERGNASLPSIPSVAVARDLGGLPEPTPPLVSFAGDGRVVIESGPPGVEEPNGSSYKLYRKRNTELDCAMYEKIADGTDFEDLGVENGIAYDYAYRIESASALSAFSRPALAIPVARPAGVTQCLEEVAPTSSGIIPEGAMISQFGEDHYRRLVVRWQGPDPVPYQPYLADGRVGRVTYLKGHRLYAYDVPGSDNLVDDQATLGALPVDALKAVCLDPPDVPAWIPECVSSSSSHSPLAGSCSGATTECMVDADCANGACSNPPADPALIMYGDGREFTSAFRGGFECLMVSAVQKVYANGTWLTVESPMGGDFDVSQLDPLARCTGIPPATWDAALSSHVTGWWVRNSYACPVPSTRPPVPAAPSVSSDAPGKIKVSWTEPAPGLCELVSEDSCEPIGSEPGGCDNPALVCSSADFWKCRLVSPQQCTTDADCTLPAGTTQHCTLRSAGEITGYRIYVAEEQTSRYHFQRPLPAARVGRDVRDYTFTGLASDSTGFGGGLQAFRFRIATETANGEVSEASPASAAITADPATGDPEPPASLKTILWTANDALHPQEIDGIKLDWKQHDALGGPSFAGYRVWRSETPGGEYCSLVQLGATGNPNPPEVGTVCMNETTGLRGDPAAASISLTTTGLGGSYYVDRTVLQGRTYYYKVSAVLSDGAESARSIAVAGSIRPHVSQPLSPPAYFKAMAPEGTGEHQGVYLRWCPNPTAEQVDGYRIYRRRVEGNFDLLADNVPPACVAGGVRCEIHCPGGAASCELDATPMVLTQTTSCTSGMDGTCKVIDLTMPVPSGDRLTERNSHTYEYVVTALRDGGESGFSSINQGWPKYWAYAGDDQDKHRFDPDNFPDTPCGEESSSLPPIEDPWDLSDPTGLAELDGLAPYRIAGIIQNPNEEGGGGGYSPPNASVRFVMFHLDHLGNVRVVTQASGALISSHQYLPFGEEVPNIAQDSSNTRQYTGHERDAETGMDYMLGRMFLPVTSRFMTVDPGEDTIVEAPQSWNKYAYVRNNPLCCTDPDGQTIQVKVHLVLEIGDWAAYHTSVLIIPDNQAKYASDPRFLTDAETGTRYATIGASRSHRGRLVSDINRSTDANIDVTSEHLDVDLQGRNEDDTIEQLFSADRRYDDSANYDLFPKAGTDGYNSNSFTPGLLGAVGLRAPRPTLPVPGYDKPLPASRFGARAHGSNGGNRKAQQARGQQPRREYKGVGGFRLGHVVVDTLSIY